MQLPLVDDPGIYLSAAKLLEDNGHILLAGALLSEAENQFPQNLVVLLRHSYFISRHQSNEEAKARWKMMQDRLPDRSEGFTHLARLLADQGRGIEADAVIVQALERFPGSRDLLAQRAFLADRRRDHSAALRHWETVLEKFPQWEMGIAFHNKTLGLLNALSLDEALKRGTEHIAAGSSSRLRHVSKDAGPNLELFLRFESLGMTCEFGLMQRLFGGEPLGLLRFASIGADSVVYALDNDLAQIIDAPDAKLDLAGDKPCWLSIPSAGLNMPTMVNPADPVAFLAQMRRRLRFLAGKLLEDLREGEKIFFYKTPNSVIMDKWVDALHAAIRRHGPGRLVCIRQPDAEHPAGSVEERADGVFIGRLPRQPLHMEDHDIESWISVCRQVWSTVEAQRAADC